MITALATVVSVEEQGMGRLVGLSCEQQTSCSHCSSQKSCGTGIVSKAIGSKSHKWILTTDKKVRVGQIVEIGLPEKKLIHFAAIVYLLPLGMLMLGAVVGEFMIRPLVADGEWINILLSLAFMFFGIRLARRLSSRLQSKTEQSVSLLRVLGAPIDAVHSATNMQ